MNAYAKVVTYLLDHEYIYPKAVVEGMLTVTDISRRNHNLSIMSETGPNYLLKQGIEELEGLGSIAHEAAIYRYLLETYKPQYLPRYYTYDEQEKLILIEYIKNAENMRVYHLKRRRFPVTLAKEMGRALALLHNIANTQEYKDKNVGKPPWILSVHKPSSGAFHYISNANIQLIKIIQRFSGFGVQLDNLRQEWQPTALIHNDLKWENIIVSFPNSSSRKPRLTLIDWELACVGDPCWDIGSFLSEYLNLWLLSIPITDERSLERFVDLTRFPLKKMQGAIGAFWQSYVEQLEFEVITAREQLIRAVRYAAARLLQSAFEWMQEFTQLNSNVICILQLALNILQEPERATQLLLGLPLE